MASTNSSKGMSSWPIRKQLIVTFALISACSLFLVILLSVINIFVLGANTEAKAVLSLESQIETNMQNASVEEAAQIGQKLARLGATVKLCTLAAQTLFTAGSSYQPSPSYFGGSDATLSSNSQGTRQGGIVDFANSSYSVPGATTTNIAGMLPSLQSSLDRSVHLDPYLKQSYSSSADVIWMYVGFASNGLYRIYPGTRIASSYDPRLRPWWASAVAAQGNLAYTKPYRDAVTNQWMITLSKAIYTTPGGNVLLGVVGLDVTIKQIQSSILSISFLTSGFAALCERALPHALVAHPGWVPSAAAAAPPNLFSVEPALANDEALAGRLWTNTAGVESYARTTATSSTAVPYFLAHAPVLGYYTVLIFVPKSEAVAPVPALAANIQSTQTEVILVSIGASLLVGAFVFWVVTWMARRLSAPVKRIVRVAEGIVSGAAEQDFTKNLQTGGDVAKLRAFLVNATGGQAGAAAGDGADGSGGGGGDYRRVSVSALPSLPASADEMVRLVYSFLLLIAGLQRDAAAKKKDAPPVPANAYYGHPNTWDVGDVVSAGAGAGAAALPSAPAMEGESKAE